MSSIGKTIRPIAFRTFQSLFRELLYHFRWVVVACFMVGAIGCGTEQQSRPAYIPPTDQSRELVSAQETEDLGIIPVGFQQAITFTVSNPSDQPLKLAVVHSSCACLNATLDESDLPPRGSTNVRVKIHAGDTSTAGPLAAEVRIAGTGSGGEPFALTLRVRGIIQGLETEATVARVPAALSGWEPRPVRGAFYFDKTQGDVEVTGVEWSASDVPEGIALGDPALSPAQDLGDHAIRRLTLPLLVRPPHRPSIGEYEGIILYRIAGVEARTRFTLCVVDALE